MARRLSGRKTLPAAIALDRAGVLRGVAPWGETDRRRPGACARGRVSPCARGRVIFASAWSSRDSLTRRVDRSTPASSVSITIISVGDCSTRDVTSVSSPVAAYLDFPFQLSAAQRPPSPSRTMWWSSTIRTRLVMFHFCGKPGGTSGQTIPSKSPTASAWPPRAA